MHIISKSIFKIEIPGICSQLDNSNKKKEVQGREERKEKHTRVKQKTLFAADPAMRRVVVMRERIATPQRMGTSQ
jgi:hypothetical protein